ncbi:MAG: AAA family ATPase [Nevskia sp.]|nr:AAA family ATPase [Nevskia sp.]
MDLNRDEDFNNTNDAAAMSGAEAPATLAANVPKAGGEEENGQEGVNDAVLAEAEEAKGANPKEALLNGTSMQAAEAAAKPLPADAAEAGEALVATNRAQRRALGIRSTKDEQTAQIGDLPPPVADNATFDPDDLTFEGHKFLVGWDALMEEAAKPVDRVIGPFEAQTLAIVSGEPGRGKSLLSLNLAVATAGGVEFSGFRPPRPQSALILSPEDKLGAIGARIKAAVEELRADPELVKRNLRVVNVPGSSIIFEGAGETLDFNALGRVLRKAIRGRRARFVVADPFIELHTADENSNMQVHALMASLRAMARETDSVIFLTHHSAKGGQGPRGAGAFSGTVRATLHVDALGKKEAKAAEAQGLRPSSIFRLVFIKDNYGDGEGGAVYFQRLAIRPGEAPVLRRVTLEAGEDE